MPAPAMLRRPAVALVLLALAGRPALAQERQPLPETDPRRPVVTGLVERLVAGDRDGAAAHVEQHAAASAPASLRSQARSLALQFGGDAFELIGLTTAGAGDVHNVVVELRRKEDGARRFMLVLMEPTAPRIAGIALPTPRHPDGTELAVRSP